MSDNEDFELEIEYVSKTEMKREQKALQDLARELIAMSKSERSKLDISDEVKEAIALGDKLKKMPDPLRRHVQFMAKLLDDSDLDKLQSSLDLIRNKDQRELLQVQQFEQLREELISGDNQAVENLISQHPVLERQKLRQLIRQAAKEKKAEKPSKGYKSLYKYLRESIKL
jgi:ribosome-associated protein